MHISRNDELFNQKVAEFNNALEGLKNSDKDIKANSASICLSIIREIGVASNQDKERTPVYKRLKASLENFEKETSPEILKKVNKVLSKLNLFIVEEEKVSTESRRAEPEGSKGEFYHVPTDLIGENILSAFTGRELFVLSKKEKTFLTETIKKDKRINEEAYKDAEALVQIYEVLLKNAKKNYIRLPKLPAYDPKSKNAIMATSKNVRLILNQYGPFIKKLDFDHLNISVLPHDIAKLLPNVTHIDFTDSTFTNEELPPELLEFANLEELNLDNVNNINNLPEDIGRLTNLKKLIFKHLDFHLDQDPSHPVPPQTKLPESFKLLSKLEELDLSFLHFTEFPPQLKDLPSLKKLDLRYNTFTSFPEWLIELNITELGIDLKDISEFPIELTRIKDLEELKISRWVVGPNNFPYDLAELYPKLTDISFSSIPIEMEKPLNEIKRKIEERRHKDEYRKPKFFFD